MSEDFRILIGLLEDSHEAANPKEALVPIELMQRVWQNLYYNEADAGYTMQATISDVVDWLAKHDALLPVINK